MSVKYLKPMLDAGSARVFNCNALTRKLLEKDANAQRFFRNPPLNNIVLIKDAVPEAERKGPRCPPVGTKLYFPFNEHDIYEGGRTIFLHDPHLQQSIIDNFGQNPSVTQEALAEDLRILETLDGLPSLDPFLMKDVFQRVGIAVNEAYFEISPEQWKEIEIFILQRFEPLVKAAFPDAMSSDEKTRRLVEKIWEAKDVAALAPLIDAFRLPENKALEIFAAWKGINFYAFQYARVQSLLVALAKWLKGIEVPFGAIPNDERTKLLATLELVKDQLRREWHGVDTILREYTDAYDKMFKHKASSSEFLGFLRNCGKAYWSLGSGLGKGSHAVYCWQVLTGRYQSGKLPWPVMHQTMRLLAEILQPEKKAATSVAWA
ncbi:MAG TPA: hypothetical protein VEI03_05890 [Stellaceae bacterium]|nr:hypothetical protein [Stellaceae bacterium]